MKKLSSSQKQLYYGTQDLMALELDFEEEVMHEAGNLENPVNSPGTSGSLRERSSQEWRSHVAFNSPDASRLAIL